MCVRRRHNCMERNILRENTVHGSSAYPFAVYEYSGKAQTQVDMHWHKEYEIIYMEKGTFSLSINMKEYEVKAPALAFVSAGDLHSVSLNKKDIESAVVFDLEMLSFENYDGLQYKIIRPLLEKRLCFPQFISPQHEVWEEAKTLYESLFLEGTKKSLSAYLRIKASLYQLIACLYEHDYLSELKEVNEGDTAKIDVMKRVLTHIRSNYRRKITIEEIAGVAGMNPQYFCRYFKKITGKTVINYLNDFRIRQAQRALLSTDGKIIEIAGECGYDNMGYFIKRFRQTFGVTPSEYRKENVKIV